MLRHAVDSLAGPLPGGHLAAQAALFAGLALGQAGAKFASRRVYLGGGRRVEHDLRAAYFAHLLRLPAGRLEAGRKGDFVSRATHDLQDVRMFVGVGALNFLQTLILLAVATVLLWRIHPGLTAAALAPFPVISVLVRRQSPRLHRRYLAADERAGDLAALVQESLSGLRVLRSYH
ncbi:MAG: ABC transporter transmembrane domain-containing protein, partial [Deferrisomatales bacterium]